MTLPKEALMEPPETVCALCGDDFPEIDEATELCDSCFEWVFGDGSLEQRDADEAATLRSLASQVTE